MQKTQRRRSVSLFASSLVLVLLFCRGSVVFEEGSLANAAPLQTTSFPLAFEANEGQWGADVRFVARGRSGLVVLDDKGLAMIPSGSRQALRMAFAGSWAHPQIEGLEPLPQTANYFLGSDPSAWRTAVRTYRRVLYREVYPGIDAVFHTGGSGELQYDFTVRPGSDPRNIRLRFDGTSSLRTNRRGELILHTEGSTIRMRAPVVYQATARGPLEVASRYRMLGKRTVGFVLGDYDPSRELVIDPVVVGYSTFLGGTGSEIAFGIAVDADRNTYLTGVTTSPDFPTKDGAPAFLAGGRDAFVAKLNPAGNQILYTTFVGGSGDDTATKIAVDSRGDVYVTGSTASSNFPVTEGAPQRTFGGGSGDAFVVKLSSDGSRLLFSTYLGGEAEDSANGLAIDPLRDVYVAGRTLSESFPITAGALQTVRRGMRDGFVAKFRVDPPTLVFSTYLGGSDEDVLRRLAVDAAGAAYVTGNTFSTDYPTTEGAFQTSFGGAGTGNQRFGDVFVTKLDPSGSSLKYSTYLGGVNGEIGNAVVVDSTGAAYVTGLSFFGGFPTTPGSYQPQHAGGQADVFVTKLSPGGDGIIFSTYLGGRQGAISGNEEAFSLAVDPLGNVHLSGSTFSTDFPTTSDALSTTMKGVTDGFVSIISHDGSQLLYSTFLGGTAPSGAPQENAFAVTVDHGGNTYVAGQTRSTDFPVTEGAVQTAYGGVDDAFLIKFTAQREKPEGETRVIPVVGSTPGAPGSFFKTSFQLHNPRETVIGGRFIFHPLGQSGSESDASLDYFLGPGETIAISDLLPAMSQSGLGSIDLLTPPGQTPESVIRIFNDAGEAGTTGMSEELIRPSEALQAGTTGVLIAPSSTATASFNIGIRTLGDGASLTITVRRSDGTVSHTLTRDFPAHYFEQRTAAEFLGVAPGPSDSIALRIDSGSAVVYGATIDNITQDPSLQLARAVDSVAGETRILPVVGSTPGLFGSFFKTAVQLHNAGASAISGRILYHAHGASGSDADPSLSYSLQPGQTVSYDDLLPAMNRSGLGSADLVSDSGVLPLSVVRIYNDAGERGTTGVIEDQVPLSSVLSEGDEGVLIAPPDPAKARFNIGIRTLGEGATITMTVRTGFGNVVKTVTKSFDPDFFIQRSAAALLETQLLGNDTTRLEIEAGSAIVYGTTTDNITQDSTLKVVRRLE